jgi:hypothetical protein
MIINTTNKKDDELKCIYCLEQFENENEKDE